MCLFLETIPSSIEGFLNSELASYENCKPGEPSEIIQKWNMTQETVQGNSERSVIKHRGLITERIMLMITFKGI